MTRAPDYAQTVAIHSNQEYDSAEMFVNPELRFPKCEASLALAKRKLRFRYSMDLTPLDPSRIEGCHKLPPYAGHPTGYFGTQDYNNRLPAAVYRIYIQQAVCSGR